MRWYIRYLYPRVFWTVVYLDQVVNFSSLMALLFYFALFYRRKERLTQHQIFRRQAPRSSKTQRHLFRSHRVRVSGVVRPFQNDQITASIFGVLWRTALEKNWARFRCRWGGDCDVCFLSLGFIVQPEASIWSTVFTLIDNASRSILSAYYRYAVLIIRDGSWHYLTSYVRTCYWCKSKIYKLALVSLVQLMLSHPNTKRYFKKVF